MLKLHTIYCIFSTVEAQYMASELSILSRQMLTYSHRNSETLPENSIHSLLYLCSFLLPLRRHIHYRSQDKTFLSDILYRSQTRTVSFSLSCSPRFKFMDLDTSHCPTNLLGVQATDRIVCNAYISRKVQTYLTKELNIFYHTKDNGTTDCRVCYFVSYK